MPVYYSPSGNPEIWDEKPVGYFTEEEWNNVYQGAFEGNVVFNSYKD